MNYNTKPVKIKYGAAIGYFNKLNDQDQFQLEESDSNDNLESISSDSLSECIYIDENDYDLSDSSISTNEFFDLEPQLKKVRIQKFDQGQYKEYENNYKKWLYYYMVGPELIDPFHLTGKLLFEGEKLRLMKEDQDLMRCD